MSDLGSSAHSRKRIAASAYLLGGALLLGFGGAYLIVAFTSGLDSPVRPSQAPEISRVDLASAATEAGKPQPGLDKVALPEQSPAAARPSGDPAMSDGLYAGPLCYGPAVHEPPRCFRAQATIRDGTIAGRWPGRQPGMTFVLDGEVSAGHAVVHLSAEQADGVRTPFLDLNGQLEDGRLDAVGSFADGRTATLNWRKAIAPSR
jgi:hypothetical protein